MDYLSKENIEAKLKKAEDELHEIERTNDKSQRLRWRDLKFIIKHYNTLLSYRFKED